MSIIQLAFQIYKKDNNHHKHSHGFKINYKVTFCEKNISEVLRMLAILYPHRKNP